MEIGIGKAITARRAILGISRKKLAECAGISYPYLAEIENGNKEPSISTLRSIAAALAWSMSDLFDVADKGAVTPSVMDVILATR